MTSSLLPKNFFSKNGPNLKLLRKEKQLKELFLPSTFCPSFSDELLKNCWRVFRTQKEALDFSRTMTGLHIFTYESSSFLENSGQRLFLVTSYDEFWHNYSQLRDDMRVHYELIPENSPCHLYFDIEFDYDINTTKDGTSMVHAFIKFVCRCFKEYRIECTENNFIVLASLSPSKFSRHIIVILPDNMAFRNNIDAGNLARYICDAYKSSLYNFDNGDCSCGDLMVISRAGSHVFCDLGVYSKNRNFRLYLSSKRGKGHAFRLAPENCYPFSDSSNGCTQHKEVFMASLICNVSKDAELLLFDVRGLKRKRDYDEDKLYSNKEIESVIRPNIEIISLPYSEDCRSSLDEFVNSLIQVGGVEGKIYKKSLRKECGLVTYDIVKNRWCRNVARFHKSNNVRLVIDLRKRTWYQMCHDPDCKNYKSQDFPIPESIEMTKEFISDWMNDDSLSAENCFDFLRNPFASDVNATNSNLDVSDAEILEFANCELTETSISEENDKCHVEMFCDDVTDDDILNITFK